MSDVFELIRQKCPDGVLYVRLGNVALISAGYGFPKKYQGGTCGFPFYKVDDMNNAENGFMMRAAENYVTDDILLKMGGKPCRAGTIIFPKIGAAVGTDKKRMLMEDAVFDNNVMGITADMGQLDDKFLLYWLSTIPLMSFVIGDGTIPSIRKTAVEDRLIPLPPLQVQREIVAILDKFDSYCNSMTAGLAGELEMRRKQYRYWAEHLVMDGNVEMVELGKLCRINKGTQMNKSDYQDGPYPIYNMGAEPSGTHTEYNRDIPSIVIAGHGNSCGFVNWVDEPFWAGGGCYYLDSLAPDLSNRYLYHAMKVREGFLMGLGSHGPIRHLYPRTIARLQVPVPVSVPGTGAWDIARQQSICDTLDKFLTLEHELEHELELRRKQYGYYRDMLLRFPEQKGV